MRRRTFLTLSAATAASAVLPLKVCATAPRPYNYDAAPPMDNITAFVGWMQENRGGDPKYLRPRFKCF